MTIDYKDHLRSASSRQLFSTSLITSPLSHGASVELNFDFTLKYDGKELLRQAEVFSNQIRSNSSLSTMLDKTTSLPYNERDNILVDVYRYSYFKAISSIRNLYDGGRNYSGAIPSNTLVFYGHKKLLHTFLSFNSHNSGIIMSSNVFLMKTLSYKEEEFKLMFEDQLYKSCFKEFYPGGIFNAKLERILSALKEIKGISVSSLSDYTDIGTDGEHSPLGNMAYCNLDNFGTDSFLATVSTHESLTDHVSKFWNAACFIWLKEISSCFDETRCDTPYTFVNTNKVNVSTLFAQVEAITGLPQDSRYSPYGRTSKLDLNKKDDDPNKPGTGGYPPQTSSSKGKDVNTKQTKGDKGKRNKLNDPEVESLASKTKTLLNKAATTLGRTLSSNEVKSFTLGAIEAYYNGKVKQVTYNKILTKVLDSKIIVDRESKRFGIYSLGKENENKQISFNPGME